jgi:hypothetical protein
MGLPEGRVGHTIPSLEGMLQATNDSERAAAMTTSPSSTAERTGPDQRTPSRLMSHIPGPSITSSAPTRIPLEGTNTDSGIAWRAGPNEVAADRSEGTCCRGCGGGIIRSPGDPECRVITQLVQAGSDSVT